MAKIITPAQRQQAIQRISQQVQAIAQQVPRLAQQVGTFAQARAAGMPITPKTTIEAARTYLAAKQPTTTIKELATTTIKEPETAIPTPQQAAQQYQARMEGLLKQYERALAEKPTIVGLPTEERALYQRGQEQLKERYQRALEDLQRKQQEEQQRLAARYAAAGFTEPGILGGPMAGVPGLVTRALQELGEKQARERVTLEQARAGDILAAQQAEAEAERRARERAYGEWAERQSRQLENLLRRAGFYETFYKIAQPERREVAGRVLERDPVTGGWRDVTPEETLKALREKEAMEKWQVVRDELTGEIYAVNPITGEQRRIGKISPKPAEVALPEDIETYARGILEGAISEVNVPKEIRTEVMKRVKELRKTTRLWPDDEEIKAWIRSQLRTDDVKKLLTDEEKKAYLRDLVLLSEEMTEADKERFYQLLEEMLPSPAPEEKKPGWIERIQRRLRGEPPRKPGVEAFRFPIG